MKQNVYMALCMLSMCQLLDIPLCVRIHGPVKTHPACEGELLTLLVSLPVLTKQAFNLHEQRM